MLSERAYLKIEKATLKIYEGLCNQISENKNSDEKISLEELDTKIDIIMDALGLSVSKSEKEEPDIEEKTEDIETKDIFKETSEEDNTDHMEEETIDEDEENIETKESLDSDNTKKKYKLEFLDSREYASDLEKLDKTVYYFDTLDELVKFLTDRDFISYKGVDKLMNKDEDKDKGLLYITSWYEVSKTY